MERESERILKKQGLELNYFGARGSFSRNHWYLRLCDIITVHTEGFSGDLGIVYSL